MTTIEHPVFGKVECVRSMRARSIRLMVRADGSIRITYPIIASRTRALEFLERKRDWVEATRARLATKLSTLPTIAHSEGEQLRREAHATLPALLHTLATRHGFDYSSLRISSAHTRWGSCSARNGISLSLFVMLLPHHLREFIILHELCHTRHHNHSAAFHALLNRCVEGKEKALNRELKAYHIPRVESTHQKVSQRPNVARIDKHRF